MVLQRVIGSGKEGLSMRRGDSDTDVRNAPPTKRHPSSGAPRQQKPTKRRPKENRVVVLDRRETDPTRREIEKLTESLLAQDKDLARILRDLDKIAKILKTGSLNPRALQSTLERTVLCALKQSILDRELRSIALSDDLTSLYTRRAFFALANQQIRLMRRKGQGLLLFFADVDKLKEINDRYGHREGDLALVRVANALQRTFRISDILARLGGDEFVVLALEASGEDEAAILSRLERHLRESSVKETRYTLSVSVGMARFDPRRGASLGDLLAKADHEMYEAKRQRSKARLTQTAGH